MTRTIKFRGKNKHRGWVYGNLIKTWNNRFWIIDGSKSRGGWLSIYGRFEVDPTTLGQFTGLYDKNGKEIYEWDTLYDDKDIYLVYFDENKGMYMMRCYYTLDDEYSTKTSYEDPMNDYYHEKFEVIGNIHDNKELIR